MCPVIKRSVILYNICVSFIFAALPSVIQTVTFPRAAGSIRPARRLQWRPRGPVVKDTLSSNMGICTQIGSLERKLAHRLHKCSPRCSFQNRSVTQIKRRIMGTKSFSVHFPSIFSPAIAWRKQRFTSTHSVFFPLLFLLFFLFLSPRPPLSGGFSETYSALCDYNGISCKEEVQWVRAVGLCLCRCECFWVLRISTVRTNVGGRTLQHTGSRLMSLPRTWTPSITPRTTASLTCWTSATWRAGEG